MNSNSWRPAMNIGLDWDGTVTTNPKAWLSVVETLHNAGFSIFIVTMRYRSEIHSMEHLHEFLPYVSGVETTGRQAKAPHMEALGIPIHIWIDDNPKAVHQSAQELWGQQYPEGQTFDKNVTLHKEELANQIAQQGVVR